MRLGDKQELFSEMLAHLVLHMIGLGYKCRIKEVLRTKEQAEFYAKNGKGILNSNHRNGVAADLMFSKDGVLLWDGPAYRIAAEYWGSLQPSIKEARSGLEFCAGYNFKRRDVYHFSIKHGGVM